MSESQNQGSGNLNEHPSELLLTVKETAHHINESPHVIRNWMRELKSHIPTQKGENNNYIKESINKRDQQLLEAMNKMQQAKIESAAEKEKKRGFWSFLRKK